MSRPSSPAVVDFARRALARSSIIVSTGVSSMKRGAEAISPATWVIVFQCVSVRSPRWSCGAVDSSEDRDDPLHQVVGGHLKGEEQHWAAVLDGYLGRRAHREAGLAATRARCDHVERVRAVAHRDGVIVDPASRQPCDELVALGPFLQDVEILAHEFPPEPWGLSRCCPGVLRSPRTAASRRRRW